ncbi:MAG TPA: carbon-nitrogen hydrolase family protein [Thermogutta sp.]|nr:carbon-nitrogen hydrolase family protein [Thermogutta sp.]HPU06448.1 carbon-nitrogen hydrolase family protein [Thermogutta sp.]HQF14129.1 carbon-nitrogen hydrolase family protein [Thermogutta sp.]
MSLPCYASHEKVLIVPTVVTTLLLACTIASYAETTSGPENLVTNPTFAGWKEGAAPPGWELFEPLIPETACTARPGEDGVVIEAPDRPFAVGGLRQKVTGIQAGKSYAVEVTGQIHNAAHPYQMILVRVTFTRGQQATHPAGWLIGGPDLTALHGSGKNWSFRFSDIVTADEEADGAEITLAVKWPQGAKVIWQRVVMRPTDPLPPRKVKVGTVYLRPRNSTPEKNLELFCAKLDEAGKLGLDIVCLGEAITLVGTNKSAADVLEPIPGPSTQRLGEAARRNHLWVVAGLYERDGQTPYNTAVLINREGQLVGKYRKVHLPREEWIKGFTPGFDYPVFETDFGKVAIQICYDWFFPEVAMIWRLKGAEIVFAPTWGNTLPDQDGRAEGETVFRVRARDAGIYLVPSVYDGNSMIIDPMGRILASNQGKEALVWAEIDLNRRERLPWVGWWRSIVPRHRVIPSYGPLLDPGPVPR